VERKIITTKDGSHSIAIPDMNVTYHSVHGALQESVHVYIEAGLYGSGRFDKCESLPLKSARPVVRPPAAASYLRILEAGLGTGLNALLTLIEADKSGQAVHYTAIELFPLRKEEIQPLNYCGQLNSSHYQIIFEKIHQCEWENEIALTPFFTLYKTNTNLIDFSTRQTFDIIYFDAFAPAAQPELWTKEMFEKIYIMMSVQATLVTYCCKGEVRRAMQAAGFTIEKLPGPAGKREMLRGRK